jgi:hypothetical protein
MRRLFATTAAISFLLGGCVQHRDTLFMPAATVNSDSITIWGIPGQEEARNFPVMSWHIDPADGGDTVRVPYHAAYAETGCMVLEGHLGDSAISYPVVLDTGAPGAVFLPSNSRTVRPSERPAVQIGSMTLVQPPCFRISRCREVPAKDEPLIVGLPALRKLSYLRFDNVRREAELSCRKPFAPDSPTHWSTYPLTIEQDASGYPGVYAEIPAGGVRIRWQLDTGSGRALSLDETTWARLSAGLPGVMLRSGEDFYPYVGRLPCKHGVPDRLPFGDRCLDSPHVSIFPDDSVLMKDCHALVGMDCFRDTVIVLDFHSATLWVRKARVTPF